MPKRTSHPVGTPSYVDIGSPDPDATAAFYSALFGWDITDLGPEAGGYKMATIGGGSVAGIGPAQNPGPPHWSTYVTVEDADITAKKIEAAGGTVLAPPFDVMEAGRMGVFLDPSGAAFSIWQPGQSIGADVVNEHGALCWSELNTRHLDVAKKFYAEVFGWTYGGGADYAEFKVGDRVVGGMMPMGPDFPADVPENWLAYFAVNDINAAVAKLTDLGGVVRMPPFKAGDAGTLSVVSDPQGAAFAVIQLDNPTD